VQLLVNLYTNSIANVSWNGILSENFEVKNGVQQGGIVSPVLFCIYIDGLLCAIRKSGVGCYIGHVFVGALAYADDVTLLAPTPQAMRHMLKICEEYGKRFSIVFNATKSAWLHVTKRKQSGKCVPQFFIDGQRIQCISRYTHLGHVISDKLDDKDDIINKRNSLCGKINNVLCYFCERDALVKLKLLRAYCSDFYGCVAVC